MSMLSRVLRKKPKQPQQLLPTAVMPVKVKESGLSFILRSVDDDNKNNKPVDEGDGRYESTRSKVSFVRMVSLDDDAYDHNASSNVSSSNASYDHNASTTASFPASSPPRECPPKPHRKYRSIKRRSVKFKEDEKNEHFFKIEDSEEEAAVSTTTKTKARRESLKDTKARRVSRELRREVAHRSMLLDSSDEDLPVYTFEEQRRMSIKKQRKLATRRALAMTKDDLKARRDSLGRHKLAKDDNIKPRSHSLGRHKLAKDDNIKPRSHSLGRDHIKAKRDLDDRAISAPQLTASSSRRGAVLRAAASDISADIVPAAEIRVFPDDTTQES